MNISIIGASAGVGLATLKRALQRGHSVTTLSRSDINIEEIAHFKKIKGSATVESELKCALDGCEAVIVALGTRGSIRATTLCHDFAIALLSIHRKNPITVPVIILSGFGSGDSRAFSTPFARFGLRFVLNKVYEDKAQMEELIRQSTINWEIVRPGLLTNGALTERYRVDVEYFKGMKTGFISRNDVADYMVKQAENPTNILKCPRLALK